MKNLSLLFFAALISLCACKKDEPNTKRPTTTQGKYLSKTTLWQTNTNTETTASSFEMNTNGDLTSVKTFTENSEELLDLTTFTKDGSGRIAQVTGTYKGQSVAYVFQYDGGNNIIKQTYTSGDSPATITQYTYDDSRRIVKIEEIKAGVNTMTKTYTYQATGNNPTGMELVTEGSQGAAGFRYTFDDKKNPFISLPKVLYYLGVGEFYDDNLLVESETDGTTRTSTYLYNADGYPTSRDDGNGSGVKFYYQ